MNSRIRRSSNEIVKFVDSHIAAVYSYKNIEQVLKNKINTNELLRNDSLLSSSQPTNHPCSNYSSNHLLHC